MGYVTTITIGNDALSAIQKHPEQFVAGIVDKIGGAEQGTFPVGGFANYVKVMKTGHADEFRLFVSYRGDTTELSEYNAETRQLVETHPEMLKKLIVDAEWQLKQLKRLLK